MRWSDVDLKGKAIAVRNARVLVAGEVIEKAPKSANAQRTRPLETLIRRAKLRKIRVMTRGTQPSR